MEGQREEMAENGDRESKGEREGEVLGQTHWEKKQR